MRSGISPENEALLQRRVALGKTRGQVIDQGLTLLRSRQKLLPRLDEGRRQLDEGEYTEYDDRELDAFFAGLLEPGGTGQ